MQSYRNATQSKLRKVHKLCVYTHLHKYGFGSQGLFQNAKASGVARRFRQRPLYETVGILYNRALHRPTFTELAGNHVRPLAS